MLWSVNLIETLREATWTDIYMYANDTATLSPGSTLGMACFPAQHAAGVMVRWASQWK